MLHSALVIIFSLPILLLVIICWPSLAIAYLLSGSTDAQGGIAALFTVIADLSAMGVDKMQKILTARKPVAMTFNGAVSYWRKNLKIARDIDSRNFEYLADLQRDSLRKMPKDFDYGTKTSNAHHKAFRFAKYVISKRNKVVA